MKLGAFSISLNVKDIELSKQFYEKLGFQVFAGDAGQNYLIMKNESTIIGLFQGMFDKNILTFNPGWDSNANTLENFNDIREIQQHLKDNNVALTQETNPEQKGPANITLIDPDGNAILIDQHIS
ncbi:VOC family protein [Wenyingzhuangia sp. chi5]|uniref:VOC family protein n=1 Tax=Wenyingzhuangia gilva TaxID=3057677 RepID=A0ABT8VMY0_9FLAO|nr:VOC family protein [Wenyingzhuangia sp. chi5]MDO3693318.1 VOC family protein [Wenyingzhuangia sp. chi5]